MHHTFLMGDRQASLVPSLLLYSHIVVTHAEYDDVVLQAGMSLKRHCLMAAYATQKLVCTTQH